MSWAIGTFYFFAGQPRNLTLPSLISCAWGSFVCHRSHLFFIVAQCFSDHLPRVSAGPGFVQWPPAGPGFVQWPPAGPGFVWWPPAGPGFVQWPPAWGTLLATASPGFVQWPALLPVTHSPGFVQWPALLPVTHSPGFVQWSALLPVTHSPGFVQLPALLPVTHSPGFVQCCVSSALIVFRVSSHWNRTSEQLRVNNKMILTMKTEKNLRALLWFLPHFASLSYLW